MFEQFSDGTVLFGIENGGNHCYFLSFVQMLLGNRLFRMGLLSVAHKYNVARRKEGKSAEDEKYLNDEWAVSTWSGLFLTILRAYCSSTGQGTDHVPILDEKYTVLIRDLMKTALGWEVNAQQDIGEARRIILDALMREEARLNQIVHESRGQGGEALELSTDFEEFRFLETHFGNTLTMSSWVLILFALVRARAWWCPNCNKWEEKEQVKVVADTVAVLPVGFEGGSFEELFAAEWLAPTLFDGLEGEDKLRTVCLACLEREGTEGWRPLQQATLAMRVPPLLLFELTGDQDEWGYYTRRPVPVPMTFKRLWVTSKEERLENVFLFPWQLSEDRDYPLWKLSGACIHAGDSGGGHYINFRVDEDVGAVVINDSSVHTSVEGSTRVFGLSIQRALAGNARLVLYESESSDRLASHQTAFNIMREHQPGCEAYEWSQFKTARANAELGAPAGASSASFPLLCFVERELEGDALDLERIEKAVRHFLESCPHPLEAHVIFSMPFSWDQTDVRNTVQEELTAFINERFSFMSYTFDQKDQGQYSKYRLLRGYE